MSTPDLQPGDFYRDGPLIVAADGAVLPARCFTCNSTDCAPPVRKTFVSSAVGQPTGAISGAAHFATRRTATAWITLCRVHRLRRIIAIGYLVALIGGFVTFMVIRPPANPMLGLILIVVVVLLTAPARRPIRTTMLTAVRIDGGRVWLSGAGDSYLDSLPRQQTSA